MSKEVLYNPDYEALDDHPLLKKDAPFDAVRPKFNFDAHNTGQALSEDDFERVVSYAIWLDELDANYPLQPDASHGYLDFREDLEHELETFVKMIPLKDICRMTRLVGDLDMFYDAEIYIFPVRVADRD